MRVDTQSFNNNKMKKKNVCKWWSEWLKYVLQTKTIGILQSLEGNENNLSSIKVAWRGVVGKYSAFLHICFCGLLKY